MTKGKLRLCKVTPGATVTALFGYTCAVFTDPALIPSQLNAVILTWLGLANLAALGALAWALHTDDIDDLRAMVAHQRPSPRLRFMPPLQAVPDPEPASPAAWTQVTPRGAVYGPGRAAVEQRVEQDLFDQLERGLGNGEDTENMGRAS